MITSLLISGTARTGISPNEQGENEVYICGMRLLEDSGKTGKDAAKLPALYTKHSSRKDVEFMKHVLSLIYVESRFNRSAWSEKDAVGLMQMTQIAVDAASDHCRLKRVFDMHTLQDSATNIRYGSCYLRKMLDEVDGDWDRAMILYNGGYKQLQRYDRGDTVVNETANYVLSVHRALTICEGRMEIQK